MKARWSLAALLAVAGLAAGCAANREEPATGPDPLAAQEAYGTQAVSMLHVHNRNWQDVDVYAVRQGAQLRLGTVAAMSNGDFDIPLAISAGGEFQFMVAPVGDTRGYTTQSVMLNEGQVVDLQVENTLSLSTFSIR